MTQVSTTKALTSLPALAAQINNLHTQCEESYKNSLEFARRAGELLLKVKSQVAHGQWLPWIEENTVISPRTAQVYMRLARNWHEFSSKYAEFAPLTIESALKLLTPEAEVVDAELLEEEDAPLPPAVTYSPVKRSTSDSNGRGSAYRSTSKAAQSAVKELKQSTHHSSVNTEVTVQREVLGLSTPDNSVSEPNRVAATSFKFSPGVRARVIGKPEDRFYGEEVEVFSTFPNDDVVLVAKLLRNNQHYSFLSENLQPITSAVLPTLEESNKYQTAVALWSLVEQLPSDEFTLLSHLINAKLAANAAQPALPADKP